MPFFIDVLTEVQNESTRYRFKKRYHSCCSGVNPLNKGHTVQSPLLNLGFLFSPSTHLFPSCSFCSSILKNGHLHETMIRARECYDPAMIQKKQAGRTQTQRSSDALKHSAICVFLQPHLRFPTHYWMPDLETATIWHARATVGDHLGIVHSWLLKRPTNQLTSLRGCIFGRRLFYSIRMCVYTTDEMGFIIAYIYQLVWICIAYL